ncbi:flagellar hook capping protein [Clostridium bornimense]|uniref:Basal-body rod modification protein FlgD n=1 Tax=Clostridium bornimense TaxID=1216932 RepID=W6S398_9CLOT|nr:flagellar hook capping FlgD N-terminal domain-containing protein [Clostridium bornimense]CDM68797.1 flagellar hook capping protein [Clostridium bornimense]
MSDLSLASTLASSTTGKTSNGTKITTSSNDLDKNSFVKILAAQLANQDPTNPVDSTAYVSQLAEFTALEQMTNLNETMSYMSATNMVGKFVMTKYVDDNNVPISGTVLYVSRRGSETTVVLEGYEDTEFKVSDIQEVVNGDTLVESQKYVGQTVITNLVDSNNNFLEGKVTQVINGYDGIYAKVQYEKDGELTETTIGIKNIIGVKDPNAPVIDKTETETETETDSNGENS